MSRVQRCVFVVADVHGVLDTIRDRVQIAVVVVAVVF